MNTSAEGQGNGKIKNTMKAAAYLIWYVIFQMVITSVFAMVLVQGGGVTSEAEAAELINRNVLFITIVSNVLTILILFLFFCIRGKKFAGELKLRKVTVKGCMLPCIASFSYSMVFSTITYNVNFNNAKQIESSVNYYSGIAPYLGVFVWIAALLIAAPIAEEVIFHGLIMTRLQRSFSDITAIIVSAVLFGLIHVMAGGGVLIIGAFLIGIILGFICVGTKSLLPAVLAHMAANLPDFLFAALPALSKPVQYVLVGVCLAVFIVSFSTFLKKEMMKA